MAVKRTKNQIRRERQKLKKQKRDEPQEANAVEKEPTHGVDEKTDAIQVSSDDKRDINGKPTNGENEVANDVSDPEVDLESMYPEFRAVFERYSGRGGDVNGDIDGGASEVEDAHLDSELALDALESLDSLEALSSAPLSKRQRRILNKIPLSSLKASTSRPDIVDMHDADANDPFLLVAMKSQHNCVPVPGHWASKREYLSTRRGLDRPPFQLPKFIQDTGIQDMRVVDDRSLKQQQRDRVQPKMGKLDIDYLRLHDAFFKFQTKPRLFAFGEVYFEGRDTMDDYIDEVADMKPGVVSSQLRAALGLPENDFSVPPPWMALFEEIGKPPAYEGMVIPGLDAPYDNDGYRARADVGQKVDESLKVHWGKPEAYEEDEEEDEEEEEEEEEEEQGEEQEEEQEEAAEDAPVEVTEEENQRVEITEVGLAPSKLYTVLDQKPTSNSSPEAEPPQEPEPKKFKF